MAVVLCKERLFLINTVSITSNKGLALAREDDRECLVNKSVYQMEMNKRCCYADNSTTSLSTTTSCYVCGANNKRPMSE